MYPVAVVKMLITLSDMLISASLEDAGLAGRLRMELHLCFIITRLGLRISR
ncbi:hypothetical protein GCM10010353_66890 [Streptomyces chryseus]|nr:hypothetical protein GCM10010353_66890 [Streptomyces chryseus]